MANEDRNWNGEDGLTRMVDRALEALSTSRQSAGLTVVVGDALVVRLGDTEFRFGNDDRSRTLTWERLVDALPTAVEHARLLTMHKAASEPWPAPWSVYTTVTTAAWLAHASGGCGTLAWTDMQQAILSAAEVDGGIALTSEVDMGSLTGVLRSRQLHARIRLSRDVRYNSIERILIARDLIPDTVATAIAGNHPNLADIVEMPWVGEAGVLIDAPTVGSDGTVLLLSETLVSLNPVPDAALRKVPTQGPKHAPWIVTAEERQALDVVDSDAHLSL